MLVRCECGWEKEVRDELQGKTAQCPKCGAKFELQPAGVVAAAESALPEPVSLMPVAAETEDDDAWLPPGIEADEEEAFEAAPLTSSPPKPSPWKTPNLKTLRDRVKGHYPLVVSASWCLEIYSALVRVFALLFAIGAVIAFFGMLFGLVLIVAPGKGGGFAAAGGSMVFGVSLGWCVALTYVSFTLYMTGAVCGGLAELSVAWAAGLAGQHISPCGGLRRRE